MGSGSMSDEELVVFHQFMRLKEAWGRVVATHRLEGFSALIDIRDAVAEGRACCIWEHSPDCLSEKERIVNAFEAMIDELVQVNRALTERRACLRYSHWLTCPRCYAEEDAQAVLEGRACFPWKHTVACMKTLLNWPNDRA